jgi:hypothetical protein
VAKEGAKIAKARDALAKARLLHPDYETMSCGTSSDSQIAGSSAASVKGNNKIVFAGDARQSQSQIMAGRPSRVATSKTSMGGIKLEEVRGASGEHKKKSYYYQKDPVLKSKDPLLRTRYRNPQLDNICQDRDKLLNVTDESSTTKVNY